MRYARCEGSDILEYRDFEDGELPAHKAFLWKPVEIQGEGDTETVTVEDARVLIVKSQATPGVPRSVSPYQARVALFRAGLLDAVNAAIEGGSVEMKLAWEYATSIDRSSQFIAALTPALSMTEADVDALFVQAASVT